MLEPYWTRDGDDPGRDTGRRERRASLGYECVVCCFQCRTGDEALGHYERTGHDVRVAYRPAWRQQ